MITEKQFNNTINKVMEYNEYTDDMITDKICSKKGKWTPIDLIMREYYNNGCGSAEGFLGISPKRCENAAKYIIEHQQEFKEKEMYSREGFNNSGFTLWTNYELETY